MSIGLQGAIVLTIIIMVISLTFGGLVPRRIERIRQLYSAVGGSEVAAAKERAKRNRLISFLAVVIVPIPFSFLIPWFGIRGHSVISTVTLVMLLFVVVGLFFSALYWWAIVAALGSLSSEHLNGDGTRAADDPARKPTM